MLYSVALIIRVEVSAMKVIVRVGGSVVGSPLNAQMINRYVTFLKDLKNIH